ncbi:MAG TPA: PilN domain-containing protein [Acidobacteriaceae bacterium]|nr:PilN domain-containing protein [Acidobacteriaceae bacterium]
MRVQVNLASRPFVELRPFFLRLRLVMAALVALGLGLAIAAHMLSVRAETQQAELDRLRSQTIAVQQAKLRTEQRLRQPANALVLDRAHFLNALFLRKSFSWTAVMMDLENVLPAGVQVTSIEPQIAPTGNVVIRLRVAGQRANAVQLVRNLERSRRFLAPRLIGEASQTKENTAASNTARPALGAPQAPAAPAGVEFEILADYNPLPPGESYTAGHGHVPVAARTAPAERTPRVPGNRAAVNLRNGYPAEGVKLKPYSSPAAAGQGGQR